MSQRCLDYWDEKGLVKPSCLAAGNGDERQYRRYSFKDLLKLSVVQRLRKAGLSLQKIQDGLKILRGKGCTDPLDTVLITDGKTLFRRKGEKLEDVLGNGQLVFAVVVVGQINRELRESVLQMQREEEEVNRRRIRSSL